jgi:uncharacterized protein (TIGR02466 family)
MDNIVNKTLDEISIDGCNINFEHLFPTTIYSSKLSDKTVETIQKELDVVFFDLKSKNKFKKHEKWNTHLLSDPSFTENLLSQYQTQFFQQEIKKHIIMYLIGLQASHLYENLNYKIKESWMTLAYKGDYAHAHSHGTADISGVYYYKTAGIDGSLYFPPLNTGIDSSYILNHTAKFHTILPETGKLVLFPGNLTHGVETNTTDNERVSVSFNVYIDR